MEKLIAQLNAYTPFNEEEEADLRLILHSLQTEQNLFTRENELVHMTASAWIVNRDRTRILMAYPPPCIPTGCSRLCRAGARPGSMLPDGMPWWRRSWPAAIRTEDSPGLQASIPPLPSLRFCWKDAPPCAKEAAFRLAWRACCRLPSSIWMTASSAMRQCLCGADG